MKSCVSRCSQSAAARTIRREAEIRSHSWLNSKNARGLHPYRCDSACMARIIRTKTKELLVGAEEVVVGGVRYQRLLTDVGECRASGSRSGSSLCI